MKTLNGVAHKHGNGHRPYTARHGGDIARNVLNRLKINISDQMTVRGAVDTHINNRCARLDIVRRDHLGTADSCYHDVRLTAERRQVLGAGVGDGDGAVAIQQQLSHRLAHDIAATDDNGTLARQLDACPLEKDNNSFGRARENAGLVEPKTGHIFGVESIHILSRRNGVNHFLFVNMFRQRQLHQNAINALILVEAGNFGKQVGFAHRLGQFDEFAIESTVLGGLNLATHIRTGSGVVAHNDDLEARTAAVLRLKLGYFEF